MQIYYQSDGGIPLRIRVRNWLLMKLAGKSPVMLNCGFDLVDRTTAPLVLEGSGLFMAYDNLADLVDSLPEDAALRIRPTSAADERPLPDNVTPFRRITA